MLNVPNNNSSIEVGYSKIDNNVTDTGQAKEKGQNEEIISKEKDLIGKNTDKSPSNLVQKESSNFKNKLSNFEASSIRFSENPKKNITVNSNNISSSITEEKNLENINFQINYEKNDFKEEENLNKKKYKSGKKPLNKNIVSKSTINDINSNNTDKVSSELSKSVVIAKEPQYSDCDDELSLHYTNKVIPIFNSVIGLNEKKIKKDSNLVKEIKK